MVVVVVVVVMVMVVMVMVMVVMGLAMMMVVVVVMADPSLVEVERRSARLSDYDYKGFGSRKKYARPVCQPMRHIYACTPRIELRRTVYKHST